MGLGTVGLGAVTSSDLLCTFGGTGFKRFTASGPSILMKSGFGATLGLGLLGDLWVMGGALE